MRLTRGRQSEFESFAAAQGAGLVKLAFIVCGDRERAQDAAQEALIRVYQRWSRIDDPLAYARRTAVNATRQDWRRERRTDRTNAAIEELVSRQEFDHPQERLLQRDALMAALDALPHAQRAVIVLRYGLQLSEAETATTLDIPIGTVKSRVTRGLRATARGSRRRAVPQPHGDHRMLNNTDLVEELHAGMCERADTIDAPAGLPASARRIARRRTATRAATAGVPMLAAAGVATVLAVAGGSGHGGASVPAGSAAQASAPQALSGRAEDTAYIVRRVSAKLDQAGQTEVVERVSAGGNGNPGSDAPTRLVLHRPADRQLLQLQPADLAERDRRLRAVHRRHPGRQPDEIPVDQPQPCPAGVRRPDERRAG